jgi:hypothetical protein
MSDDPNDDCDSKPVPARIPALFATIHFRSEQRPDGYTDDEIVRLNELANREDGEDGDAS